MDEPTSAPRTQRDTRAVLRIAARLDYLRRVEDNARRRLLRPLTVPELVEALRRYPGD
jgi:hypothetical protein